MSVSKSQGASWLEDFISWSCVEEHKRSNAGWLTDVSDVCDNLQIKSCQTPLYKQDICVLCFRNSRCPLRAFPVKSIAFHVRVQLQWKVTSDKGVKDKNIPLYPVSLSLHLHAGMIWNMHVILAMLKDSAVSKSNAFERLGFQPE